MIRRANAAKAQIRELEIADTKATVKYETVKGEIIASVRSRRPLTPEEREEIRAWCRAEWPPDAQFGEFLFS